MTNRLIIFEDELFSNFYPLTLSQAVFSLRCGTSELWEAIARKFPGYEVTFSCRPEIAPLLKHQTGLPANSFDYTEGDRLVFVNGRLRLGEKLNEELLGGNGNRIFHHNDITAAVVVMVGNAFRA